MIQREMMMTLIWMEVYVNRGIRNREKARIWPYKFIGMPEPKERGPMPEEVV